MTTWLCGCGKHNHASFTACQSCGATREPVPVDAAGLPTVIGGAIPAAGSGASEPRTSSASARHLADWIGALGAFVLVLTVIGGVLMIAGVGFVGPSHDREVSPLGLALSVTATLYSMIFALLLLGAAAVLQLLADVRDALTPSDRKAVPG